MHNSYFFIISMNEKLHVCDEHVDDLTQDILLQNQLLYYCIINDESMENNAKQSNSMSDRLACSILPCFQEILFDFFGKPIQNRDYNTLPAL